MGTHANDRQGLLEAALGEVLGAALVLDPNLNVVAATDSAEALLGELVPRGIGAARLLCGESIARPIAEALGAGRAVDGLVSRPDPSGGLRGLRVRATPLAPEGAIIGWVLLLDEAGAAGEGAEVIEFHGMLTADAGMKRVFHVVERAAKRDVSVLVRGESGTGKELLARAVHDLSPRAKGPFMAINCAALPPTLLESELFGHVKGAFTGAVRDAPGFFQSAHGGTAFLDEVAEMPLDLQAKLLRVLETKTVVPVGGRTPIEVDARIVAATHQGLRRAVEEGRFRADLMYRLRVVPVFLPPLRARPGDVSLLTLRFVELLNAEGGRHVDRVAPGALRALEAYPWPGNVRELRNALEYAFVVGEGSILVEGDLPPELLDPSADAESSGGPALGPIDDDPEEPNEVKRIRRALERAAGSRSRAAQMLGISRTTLWRRMRELGIED